MNTSGEQTRNSAAADALSPGGQVVEKPACWNEMGVQGDSTCPELEKFIHCRNCPDYAGAGVQLLERPLPPEYRRERTEYFSKAKPPATPRGHSAVVFRIGAAWLALPAAAFQEAAERRGIHSLPHRQAGIVLGLVNIRGELLICVSLGHFLCAERVPPSETLRVAHERLLVAGWDGSRFVFPVDEIHGIHRFETAELNEPPATRVKSNPSCIQGILPWQERAVGLLDAKLLFSCLNRSLT